MTIGVLVPSFRRPQSLAVCLQAIWQQSRQPDAVIVSTREGDHETHRVLEPWVRRSRKPFPIIVATAGDGGVQAALEAGFELAHCDVVAFTDDDSVPSSGWLEGLQKYYRAGVGGVGGRDIVHPSDERPRQSVVGRVLWYGRTIGNHHVGVGPPRRVDVLKGVNMSLRRELCVFDYHLLGRGAQVHWEMALCLRARRLGWHLIYDPETVVDHYPAVRPSGDSRTERAANDVEAEAYNLSRALFEYAAPGVVGARLAYRTLLGDHSLPGLARSGVGLLRGDDTWHNLRPSLRGALRAARDRLNGRGTPRNTPEVSRGGLN